MAFVQDPKKPVGCAPRRLCRRKPRGCSRDGLRLPAVNGRARQGFACARARADTKLPAAAPVRAPLGPAPAPRPLLIHPLPSCSSDRRLPRAKTPRPAPAAATCSRTRPRSGSTCGRARGSSASSRSSTRPAWVSRRRRRAFSALLWGAARGSFPPLVDLGWRACAMAPPKRAAHDAATAPAPHCPPRSIPAPSLTPRPPIPRLEQTPPASQPRARRRLRCRTAAW
jgi:hypothetical protein